MKQRNEIKKGNMTSIAAGFRNKMIKVVKPGEKDLRVRNQALAGMHFMISNKFKHIPKAKAGLPQKAKKPQILLDLKENERQIKLLLF